MPLYDTVQSRLGKETITIVGFGKVTLERAVGRSTRLNLDRQVLAREPGAEHYRGLSRTTLWLSGISSATATAHLNLVVPPISSTSIFAGIRTALHVAVLSAAQAEMPLRIIAFQARLAGAEERAIRAFMAAEWPEAFSSVSFLDLRRLDRATVSDRDVWVPTHWTTAHAVDIAARLNLIDRSRVMYLVQDYEPAFMASSTDSALARATYHAGFTRLINSSPLQSYLHREEGIETPAEHVFAPSLDLDRLRRSAEQRQQAAGTRILFYGRPSKPRNMFSLGVSVLKCASAELERRGTRFSVASAGEQHKPVALSTRTNLEPLGSLSWDGYFDRLAVTDVVLSLQATPHPSHPPLDAVVSGARAVTNELADTRGNLSPSLLADRPDPDVLAARLLEAVSQAQDHGPGGYDEELFQRLGNGLESAVGKVLAQTL